MSTPTSASSASQSGGPGGPAGPDLDVRVQVQPHMPKVGTRVTLCLSILNPTGTPVALRYPTAKTHDFLVLSNQTEIWRWSDDKVFALVPVVKVVGPGRSVVYCEFWNQKDRSGRPVGPGTYTVVGLHETEGAPPAQPRATLIIRK